MRTAIWKAPAEGRVRVGRLGLAGDGQADLVGHGGEHRAVLVYQLGSYRHWAAHLGRPDLVHGDFGENLTVEELADDDVCVGDRYRVGSALLEVSQPRVSCFKLGLRLGDPRMPALVVAHRRPGFYLRVLAAGELGAGDVVEKVADGPGRVSVAEVDALLYSSHHPPEALRLALRIPALSPGWRASFEALLAAADAGGSPGNAGLVGTPAVAQAWQGFRAARVVSTRMEGADIRSFDLVSEAGPAFPDALPGQHLPVKVAVDGSPTPVTRMYSLCGPPGSGTYRIAVRLMEGGVASRILHDRLRVGDRLDVGAPRGSFTLAQGSCPVVLLSAGVGVTPLLAMLYALADGRAPRDLWWVHGARDGASHAFAWEARRLVAATAGARSTIVYSRPRPEDRPGLDYDHAGHVDRPLLERSRLPSNADFYVCGPAGFIDQVSTALRELGVPEAKTHAEAFGPAALPTRGQHAGRPRAPTGVPGGGPTVTFARSGLSVPWDEPYASILELAEACDVPVRWSCRAGVCHSCETGVIGGQVVHDPEPIDAPPAGVALICCSRPRTDVVLDL